MNKINPFETNVVEYEQWYDKYDAVFRSEAEALREALPVGDLHGIEVGLGTGRFSEALGIKEGIEPSIAMSKIALQKGIEVMRAKAEHLPYKDLHFDFVLMASCISYFDNLHLAFSEANRVLRHGGVLIVGVIDKNSVIGKSYEQKRQESVFYKRAVFYSIEKIAEELKRCGFNKLAFSQTLFGNLDDITEFQPAIPGYGKGSFVVIKAIKK